MTQHRDSIDIARENIPRLFLRLFLPTLLVTLGWKAMVRQR